jgi:hypothetical protein
VQVPNIYSIYLVDIDILIVYTTTNRSLLNYLVPTGTSEDKNSHKIKKLIPLKVFLTLLFINQVWSLSFLFKIWSDAKNLKDWKSSRYARYGILYLFLRNSDQGLKNFIFFRFVSFRFWIFFRFVSCRFVSFFKPWFRLFCHCRWFFEWSLDLNITPPQWLGFQFYILSLLLFFSHSY